MKYTNSEIRKKLESKYKKRITNFVRNKYKNIAISEVQNKRMYLDKGKSADKLKKIEREIYKSYEPLILEEISDKLDRIFNSKEFSDALYEAEKANRNRLHYKCLYDYQKLPISVPIVFIEQLKEYLNSNLCNGEYEYTYEELIYLTLLTIYAIIDCIKQGLIVKVGTLFTIFTQKRDIRVNLPDEKINCERILEDRIIPKVKLCRAFDFKYFLEINKNNKAILNYYKEKADRYLMLLKVKKVNK